MDLGLIKEVKCVESEKECNDLLNEKWILVMIKAEKLLRYKPIQDGRYQPYDTFIIKFVMGRTE